MERNGPGSRGARGSVAYVVATGSFAIRSADTGTGAIRRGGAAAEGVGTAVGGVTGAGFSAVPEESRTATAPAAPTTATADSAHPALAHPVPAGPVCCSATWTYPLMPHEPLSKIPFPSRVAGSAKAR
ncbi:hypothetical protein GCM10010517_46150 [Streptosporangium fragile]|uniref:Uncharacterized protein n=1 Tax=Streptosporangium fragile TaxID=46186 RepID=A0ABP6IH53_9ACTN